MTIEEKLELTTNELHEEFAKRVRLEGLIGRYAKNIKYIDDFARDFNQMRDLIKHLELKIKGLEEVISNYRAYIDLIEIRNIALNHELDAIKAEVPQDNKQVKE